MRVQTLKKNEGKRAQKERKGDTKGWTIRKLRKSKTRALIEEPPWTKGRKA